jgi:hypothetical protein
MTAAKRIQSTTSYSAPPVKTGSLLERTVMNELLRQPSPHGVKTVTKCNGLWADGYFETITGQCVPFEVKSTLAWQPLATGVFQILSLNKHKKLQAAEGWLIFEQVSEAWASKNPAAPLQEAWHCLSAIHSHLAIRLVQLLPSGQLITHPPPPNAA